MPLVFLMLYSLVPKIRICPATLITLEIVARCRYYPTTLKPSTTLPRSHTANQNQCHTAAFCQKIILEFVARCRWNGKKNIFGLHYFKNLQSYFGHTAAFCRKKNHFSLQNHWTDSSLRSKILNSAKSCLFKLVLAKLLICLLKLISIDFCLLDLTIIPGNISDLKSRNLDNTQIFPSLNNQFQMGPWFESWLRRRSLNRKLIFSRSPLAWIFWLFWVRNDWIWLVWDRPLKLVTLDFLKKDEIVMEKKLMGVFIFKNN